MKLGRLFALLSAALVLASAAPIQRSQDGTALHPERPAVGESPCQFCLATVTSFEEYLADPETQLIVTKFVNENVCDTLPSFVQDTCKQEVPVMVSAAMGMLITALDPSDVCQLLGACPASPALTAAVAAGDNSLNGRLASALAGPLDCPVCKMIVVTFMQRLQDREERQRLEALAVAACDNMPADNQAKCRQDVHQLFAALDNLMHDVDPQGVCELAEFCSGPRSLGASQKPAALGKLQVLASQLATQRPNRLQDGCQNCKMIVMEAAAILEDPKTQQEVLEYAKHGCEVFTDFKDQCEQYVTLYGPLVLNMVLGYLQPDALCTRMGYCSAATVA